MARKKIGNTFLKPVTFDVFKPTSLSGLQYAYMNPDGAEKSPENDSKTRSEITLDELDNLYKSEEAEKEAEAASKRLASTSNLVTQIKVNSSPQVVRMRANNNNKAKKINRLSCK